MWREAIEAIRKHKFCIGIRSVRKIAKLVIVSWLRAYAKLLRVDAMELMQFDDTQDMDTVALKLLYDQRWPRHLLSPSFFDRSARKQINVM